MWAFFQWRVIRHISTQYSTVKFFSLLLGYNIIPILFCASAAITWWKNGPGEEFLSILEGMLLSFAFRECCAKHYIQQAQKCVKSLKVRGAATSSSQLFVRRTPQRFVTQTRGAKTHRQKQQQEEEWKRKNKTILTYIAAAGVGMIGMSYAAVPLYRLYCQVSAGCL